PALLRKIAEEEPPRPSGHRARRTARAPIAESETRNRVLAATNIPRDLEVICLKCLAKEPPRRYATARELADDLRRWLEGRTILARPATRFERVRSWVRRNPALAAVSTVLALVLVVAIVIEARSNRRLQQALAESLLRQAQLERSSGRAGQRFEALALIAGATKRAQSSGIEMSLSNLVSMRSEIAAALALPDVRPKARWPVHVSHLDSEMDFTANLDSYVTPTADGGFTMVSAVQRSPLHHFAGSSNNPVIKLRAHPAGQWVAARFRDGHAELHPLTLTNEPVRRWPGMPNIGASFCFDPAGRFLAVITHPSTGPRFAEIFDLNSGATRSRVPAVGATAVAFDSTGARLALGGAELVVWRLADLEKLWSVPLTHAIDTLAWSPDGNRIAVALDRRRPLGEQGPLQASPVLIFDGVNGGQQSVFGEFASPVGRIAFHPDGQRLAVATWESGLILGGLEPSGERLLFEGAHRALTFSSDDDQLGYSATREELGLLEVAVPSTFRRWQPRGPLAEESFTMDGSKDGRWIATASSTRVRLWDAVSRTEIDSRPLPAKGHWVEVLFGPANECAYASAASFGVRRLGLTKAADGRLRFSDERTVGEPNSFLTVGFAHDGRSLLVTENRGRSLPGRVGPVVWLWPDADPGRARKLADNYPLLGYRVVPGSRWAITTALVAPDVSIWNFDTGERVRNLGLPGRASSDPVANGRWVVAKTAEEFGVWEVNSWKRLARWPARPDETPMNILTSPDSRLLATHNPGGRFVLRALPGGKELLLLTPPQAIAVQYHQFSPDSNRLRFMGNNGQIFEWDLIAIRQELAKLGLDW
ncbi:MAG TPA: hypothetical protein VJS65_06055, partial [Verrucomicrobiae bacterium]|nr:hypothetical protein [Verrucomicrobiae bacterium]